MGKNRNSPVASLYTPHPRSGSSRSSWKRTVKECTLSSRLEWGCQIKDLAPKRAGLLAISNTGCIACVTTSNRYSFVPTEGITYSDVGCVPLKYHCSVETGLK